MGEMRYPKGQISYKCELQICRLIEFFKEINGLFLAFEKTWD